MADHLGSYLDELVSERSQGPLYYRLGQYQTSQEIAEIVSQGKQLKPNLVTGSLLSRLVDF